MLEKGLEFVGRAIGLGASVEAYVVWGERSIAREIPRRYGRGDVEPSGDGRTGHLAMEEESEIYVSEPLALRSPRLLNVRFQRILAVVMMMFDFTDRQMTCTRPSPLITRLSLVT